MHEGSQCTAHENNTCAYYPHEGNCHVIVILQDQSLTFLNYSQHPLTIETLIAVLALAPSKAQ